MKNMNMPGFTAEKSISQSRGNYVMVIGAASVVANKVVPEQFVPLSTYWPRFLPTDKRPCLSRCDMVQADRLNSIDECIGGRKEIEPLAVAEYQCREGLYRTCRLKCISDVELIGNPLTLNLEALRRLMMRT